MIQGTKRNLIEDLLMLRVKWCPDSEYPLKIQAAWLEAVERAIEAEAKVEQLTQKLKLIRDTTL